MASARTVIDRVLTLILVGCAVVLTTVVILRERGSERADPISEAQAVKDWRKLGEEGNRIGPVRAAVEIVEFSDFQCPFCRRSYEVLKQLRELHPERVALIYRHLPLEAVHPMAFAAATAAECAADQGTFEAFHDALFESPQRVSEAEWMMLASEVSVPDSAAFRTCLLSSGPADRVRRDMEAASGLGLRGTPTFVVNGTVLTGHRTLPEWEKVVDKAGSPGS